MNDPVSKLRSATRRAKSDVANKLVSMCLHEMSRKIGQTWSIRVDGEEYQNRVRECFGVQCPYCSRGLLQNDSIVEHLDGMNRLRVGLHLPGNVLVACKKCNSEKRRDDSQEILSLANSGWESFLSHDRTRCIASCRTCLYWEYVWPDPAERVVRLHQNIETIKKFRESFPELQQAVIAFARTHPALLSKLYLDCQRFAEREINFLLQGIEESIQK
jgi:hypothetical protein